MSYKISILALIGLVLFGFTGCAQKKAVAPAKKIKEIKKDMILLEADKKKNNYPILKQGNLGQRAVVDMGIVLKMTVLNYKDREGNLIATHDIFFWAKKPDFITTNTLPKYKKDTYNSQNLVINLDLNGTIDLEKTINEERIRMKNNFNNDKKIDEFLKKELRKGI